MAKTHGTKVSWIARNYITAEWEKILNSLETQTPSVLNSCDFQDNAP